ncbi:MAG: zf-HC2 domain-containing protein, partial [Chloroflexota bacterium]
MTDGVLHLSHDDVVDLAPLHVLGALEPGEAAAVRAHVATCAIGHPELEELGSVVPALWATVDQVEPPAELKARVLAAAAEAVPVAAPPRVDRRAPTPTAARDADATEPRRLTSVGPADEAEFRPTVLSRSVDWAFRIAAVLAIVALLGWNLALQRDLNQADDYRNRVAAVLQLGSQAGSSVAFLAPQAGQAASGIAAVAADGHTELAMSGLAPTTGSAVYAAW